jgi:MerR family transcriptional regulator/heat shock protein HspR
VAQGVGGGSPTGGPLPGSPGLDKPIYTISVAAEILETHPRTLMMYENIGLVVPQRTSTNRRRFSQRDIYKLQTIQSLLKALNDHGIPPPDGLKDIDVSALKI